MSANTNARLQTIVSTIDKLVANDVGPTYMNARENIGVGENIKLIAAYQAEVAEADATLAKLREEKAKLAAEATAKTEGIEIVRLGRRIEDNAICISQTADLIQHRQQAMKVMQRGSRAYEASLIEIAGLNDSNQERAAKRLEFAAEIHVQEAKICTREARMIRLPLEIARAEAHLSALHGRIEAICRLAEEVATTLADYVRRKTQRAEAQAKAALRRQAEEAAQAEAEAKARAQAEEAARLKAEEAARRKAELAKLAPALLALMELEGLDPTDPEHLALARAGYDARDFAVVADLCQPAA